MAIRIIVRRGPGAAPVFSLGTTEPVASNTGAGVIRAYPTIELNGDQTVTTPLGIVDRIINGRVIITGDGSIENCVVRGEVSPTYTTHTQLVETSNASSRAYVGYCDISPQTPSAYISGIGNKRFYAYRCKMWHNNDDFGLFSTTDGIVNSRIEGCLTYDMARFAPDYANNNRAETHNDNAQLQGNIQDPTDIVMVGNSFIGRHSQTVGTLPTAHIQISAIMISVNTQAGCSGTWDRNWMRGGAYTFNAGGASASSTLIVTDNRFERPGTISPGNTKALVIASAATRTATGNTYIDNGGTVPVNAG